jgi:nitroreductase
MNGTPMRKDKPAQTQYPIHELIKNRWSPRAFSPRPVEREKLLALFEAARWAASSRNEQPWSFIVATRDDEAGFDKALGCVREGNARWARNAGVLLFSLAKRSFEPDDDPNRFAFHDVGLAVANLIIQATALGLYTHQMAGIYRDKVREVYQIPETHDVVAGIALGYYGELEQLPGDLQEREVAPRKRKPLTEFVFEGTWGEIAEILR